MKTRALNSEVIFAVDNVRSFGDQEVLFLLDKAKTNTSGVCRLCLHRQEDDPVHEMLIAKRRDSRYPPHRHKTAEESLSILYGLAILLLFDDQGRVVQRFYLGVPGTGRASFVRIPASCYHDLEVESDFFVFLETKPGPFDPADNEAAPFKCGVI